MEPLSLHQVAAACRGDILAGAPDLVVRRVGTDSRQTEPGDLFVALVGDRHDGHAHVGAAVERGAIAVLGARSRRIAAPAGCALVVWTTPGGPWGIWRRPIVPVSICRSWR